MKKSELVADYCKKHLSLSETCDILKKDYPSINLRLLDHLIWNYQRDFK